MPTTNIIYDIVTLKIFAELLYTINANSLSVDHNRFIIKFTFRFRKTKLFGKFTTSIQSLIVFQLFKFSFE